VLVLFVLLSCGTSRRDFGVPVSRFLDDREGLADILLEARFGKGHEVIEEGVEGNGGGVVGFAGFGGGGGGSWRRVGVLDEACEGRNGGQSYSCDSFRSAPYR